MCSTRISTLLICVTLLIARTALAQHSPSVPFRALGVKINVTDMDKAIDFYVTRIGFPIVSKENYPHEVILNLERGKVLILKRVANLLPQNAVEARAAFTLQVNELDSAIAKLKARGVDFRDSQKRKEGVGFAITFFDPFENRVSLMHQTISKVAYFTEPRLYNFGFVIPDMEAARRFYTHHFGFCELSERYLPNDMPLGNNDGSFGFMLHYREGIEAVRHNSSHAEHTVILFQTDQLTEAIKILRASGVHIIQKDVQECALGKYVSFYDPFGLVSELVEVRTGVGEIE